MRIRDEKLQNIINWAEINSNIRVVLLTSSLVNPLAPVDDLSDLDIELVFENNEKYVENNLWLNNFGTPIAMIEEDETSFDGKHAMKMLLYEANNTEEPCARKPHAGISEVRRDPGTRPG